MHDPVPLAIAREKAGIVRQIHTFSDRERPDAQRYIGSPVPVLGLSVPEMRAVLASFRGEHRDVDLRDVRALAASLWRGKTFEEKALAMILIDAFAPPIDDASWRLLDAWINDCVGWGMCDSIGAGPIARMVYAKPSRFRDVLRWTKSPNPWRRRISVYALHDFVLAGHLDKPFQLLEKLLRDDELWVQRAVGTWLREAWKKDGRRTEAFLRKHVKGLPRVVITVATERAPKALRDELRRKREAPQKV